MFNFAILVIVCRFIALELMSFAVFILREILYRVLGGVEMLSGYLLITRVCSCSFSYCLVLNWLLIVLL